MSALYVVSKGKVPGIYSSWAECSEQVLHFKGNVHKKYSSYEQALEAFNSTINSIPSQTCSSISIIDNVLQPWGNRCLKFVGNVGMAVSKWLCCGHLQKDQRDESLLV